MTAKTKIFSLVILGLVVVPIMFFPAKGGQVLGVREEVAPATQQQTQQTTREPVIKDIASGAREAKAAIAPATQKQSYSGKVVWEEKQKVKVTTDRFPLGASIKVQTKSKTVSLVVNAPREQMPTDTVLIVNRDTFIELGGNPESDRFLEVTVGLDE